MIRSLFCLLINLPIQMTSESESIYFVGDVHGYWTHFMPSIERDQPAAVVLLGDIEADQPLGEILRRWDYDPARIWIIPGNHDADRRSLWSNLSAWRMERRDLHGQVVEIAGRRIAGLGGVFYTSCWDGHAGPVERLAGRDTAEFAHHAAIRPGDLVRLRRQGPADILVTHEAPSCHHLGHPALDELAAELGVQRHFHGHHHVSYTRSVGNVTVVGVDMGGIVDQDGREILKGLSPPAIVRPADAWRAWEEAEAAGRPSLTDLLSDPEM